MVALQLEDSRPRTGLASVSGMEAPRAHTITLALTLALALVLALIFTLTLTPNQTLSLLTPHSPSVRVSCVADIRQERGWPQLFTSYSAF